MARYIDADELLQKLPDDLPYKASVKRVLTQAPTADVVEVVRCGKCEHFECRRQGILGEEIGECYNNDFPFHCESRPIMKSTDFCSYGERE